ncbi:hypothetical protein [Arthrobacter sp. JCM 19049]|uniref:hypothetical protein n=1 Tax=Arthrobacter sp. JCM 19049 TaxID=1460643 RepID=UPI0006D08837|nr:hypothetical protein [Arthrobacter sp. JCM 19049]
MGYEINYSEKDYAAAAHGCARAAEALHRVKQLLASTQGRILLSAAEARLTAAQAGLAPPLVHLTQLAELVQQGTAAANDAQAMPGNWGQGWGRRWTTPGPRSTGLSPCWRC